MFRPAAGHVEIEPMTSEGIIVDANKKYEEAGKVITFPSDTDTFETNCGTLKIGDIVYFDSYACRATPETLGKKHYCVNTLDGGIFGIEHVETK